jgi:hypothetical protein
MEIATYCRWAILPPLLLADSGYFGIIQQLSYTLSEFPKGFGHFPVAFLYPFSSIQQLSNSL